MAGVGFELKKLFYNKQGYVNTVKSYSISAIVTEGPMILCVLMLFLLRYLMVCSGGSYAKQEIFLVTITYTMIFSLMISSAILFFVSRYISDCIYEKKYDRLMSAFYGTSVFLLIVGGTIAALFLYGMNAAFWYKIIAFTQFCLMLVLWTQLIFLSAIKKYIPILVGFVVAMGSAVLIGAGLMWLGVDTLLAALLGSTLGYFILLLAFMLVMLRHYPSAHINIFACFPALDQYKILVIIGFFMSLGLYGHNFVIWFSEYGTTVLQRYRYCMIYDIPAFYACLTIIPMIVRFVVMLEVNFYEKYRDYLDTVVYGGRLQDIKSAHKMMTQVLFREIAYMIQIQLFMAILSIIFVASLLQFVGVDSNMLGIFRMLCFGYCFYGLERCVTIVLLYFDDRVGAFFSSVVFAVMSIAMTVWTLELGIEYYGLGFFVAGVVASIVTLVRLYRYLKGLDYNVFCKQPLIHRHKVGVFTQLGKLFGGVQGEE